MSDETDMYATLKSRLRRPSAKLLLSPSGAPLTPSTNSGSPPSRRQPATLSLQAAVAETLLSEDSADGLPARTCSVTLETAPLNQWKLHGFSWDLGRRSLPSKLKKSTKILLVEQENVANNSSSKVEEAAPAPDTITTLKKEEEEAPLVPSLPPPLISPLSLPEGQAEDEEESSEATLAATSPCAGGEVKRKRGRPFKGQEKPVEERLMIETCKIRRLIDDIMRKGNGESQLCLRLKNIARDLDEVLAMDSLPAHTHHQIHEEPSAAGDLSLPDTLQNLIPQENDLHVE